MKIHFLVLFYLISFIVNAKESRQVIIPAGEFLMGCSITDKQCDTDEGPLGGIKITLPAFKIDRFETTVSDFRECVLSNSCKRPFDTHRNQYCNYDNPDRDDHPVNCVNWQHASQYCTWRGGRLLYEAEWEKAARAGKNNQHYSWGDQIASCKHAIMDDTQTTTQANGNQTDGCGEDRTWPVASRASNAYGIYDINGGVAEWVQNWYQHNALQALYQNGNLAGPKTGKRKVIRGGAWDEQAWALSNSGRWAKIPTGHSSIYGSNGIRCAYDIPSSKQQSKKH